MVLRRGPRAPRAGQPPWRPRRDERLVVTNILLLLALPLLASAAHLYSLAGNYDLLLPVQSDRPVAVRVSLNLGAGYEEADPPSTPLAASPDRPLYVRVNVPAGRWLGLSLHFDHATGATIHLGRPTIPRPGR